MGFACCQSVASIGMGIGSTKLAGEGNGRLIDQFDEITKKILVESGIEDDELFIMFDDWTNKLTAKGSQEMSYEEFTTSLKVTPNCILKKMFWKCILSSSKKRLTFVQFFCITWMFLTPPDSLCGPFLHMIYDSSCSGKMSEDDLELFVADMKLFLDPNECCYKDEVMLNYFPCSLKLLFFLVKATPKSRNRSS